MFTSFRQRLLFCFILVISISFVIVALTHFHLLFRGNILKTTSQVESTYILLLRDINVRQNFLGYDTRNPAFYQARKSNNLEVHRRLTDSIRVTIDQAVHSLKNLPYTFDAELYRIEKEITKSAILFDSIAGLIHQRGYKDFGLEGAMRNHIHWLEKDGTIVTDQILTLRRLEKDYIIRNESDYVTRLNNLCQEILFKIANRKDSVRHHLEGYRTAFNQLVSLDARIGLKDNSGLKKELDMHTAYLEQALNALVSHARQKQDEAFARLNRIYIAIISVLIIMSAVASIIISRKITRPLTELTQFITRFIDSQFTVEEQTPPVRSKDEIGRLTANFTLLKNEVISHLRYFKQKVDERTSDLQEANNRLKAVNEANSRFVPKEFLEFLGKNSIVDIAPGDQIAGEMTILFTDIRSFTEISESLSPQDNFDFINAYLKEMVPVIKANKGVIDKFIGDTVMAIFPRSPDDAVRASLDFLKAVDRFNHHLSGKGIPPISIGTGIHIGQLILGTIGDPHRLETTVISDAVNIASRIEGLTKYYQAGIVVTEEVLQQAGNLHAFCFRYLDEVRVKGKVKSVKVYEILDPEKDQHKMIFLQEYETAIVQIRERQFEQAKTILSDLVLKCPNDHVVRILLQRCQKLAASDASHEWDGIEVMKSK